jgi:hypothetical protein
VTVAQATDELSTLSEQLDAKAASTVPKGLRPVVRSFEDVVVGDVRTSLVALLAAVALVLLIASANAANLLLMRGESRRESSRCAPHSAPDAPRSSVSCLLKASCWRSRLVPWGSPSAGGAFHGLLALVPDGLPRVESIRIDATVVLATIAVAFVDCAAGRSRSGTVVDEGRCVRSEERWSAGGRWPSARHGRRILVVAQVAIAVIVVCRRRTPDPKCAPPAVGRYGISRRASHAG